MNRSLLTCLLSLLLVGCAGGPGRSVSLRGLAFSDLSSLHRSGSAGTTTVAEEPVGALAAGINLELPFGERNGIRLGGETREYGNTKATEAQVGYRYYFRDLSSLMPYFTVTARYGDGLVWEPALYGGSGKSDPYYCYSLALGARAFVTPRVFVEAEASWEGMLPGFEHLFVDPANPGSASMVQIQGLCAFVSIGINF